MKRIIIALLLVLALDVSAQTTLSKARANRLQGVGIAPEAASEISQSSGVTPKDTFVFEIDNDPQRKITLDSASDVAISSTWGDGGTTAVQKFALGASTADADDDSSTCLTAGGLSSGYCDGTTRGSSLFMYGNEVPTYGGVLYLQNGNVSGADMFMTTMDDFIVTNISGTNAFIVDAPTGDVSLPKSGSTIALQEATPSTACMGTATPNGTTNVTVTTSCAVTGSRVFFSRTGAVTNMASISVTTAPNNTSFQFASTGASDTLAGSVVWMIIKESA